MHAMHWTFEELCALPEELADAAIAFVRDEVYRPAKD